MISMKVISSLRFGLLSLVLISGAACAVAPPADTAAKKTKKTKVEETPALVAEMKEKVFNDRVASIARGEEKFNQSCVYCHGNRGSGGKARPLQNRDFRVDYLFKTITKGKKRGSLVMPPWKRTYSAEQRWELVAYIMSLSEEGKEK